MLNQSPDPSLRPGYVEFQQVANKPKLDDLWFMVGSRCNLTCSHCYVASSPKNDTLEQLTLAEVTPFIEEAERFGVEHIYFTGGEPFINREIMQMITLALSKAPVTILTNATSPIVRFIPKLKKLQDENSHQIHFRVSMDHYERAKHDAIRGKGNFDRALKNVMLLLEAGFKPIITASAVVYEDNPLSQEQIEENFLALFDHQIEVKLLPFNLEMGSNLERIGKMSKHVFISESCMKRPGIESEMFQCWNGRTVEKINGQMKVYPCPIIYNDKNFELADNLEDSFKKVYLTHKACFDFCYKAGGKCTN